MFTTVPGLVLPPPLPVSGVHLPQNYLPQNFIQFAYISGLSQK